MHRFAVLLIAGALMAGCAALDDLLPEPLEQFRGCSVQRYSIGQYHTGNLDDRSCAVDRGRRINYYEFTIGEARRVAVDLASRDFDTYLYLFTRSGDLVAENDDVIPFLDTDSRVVENLQPGRYIVGVSTFARDGTGRYTLTSNFRN